MIKKVSENVTRSCAPKYNNAAKDIIQKKVDPCSMSIHLPRSCNSNHTSDLDCNRSEVFPVDENDEDCDNVLELKPTSECGSMILAGAFEYELPICKQKGQFASN